MKFAKAMKGDGGAESTKSTNFRKGSTAGIPASTMTTGAAKTKGNTAKFKANKKMVGK
jgi:hypothetical protein